MGNIINNNFNNLKIKLNLDEYWDFFVCKDNDMGGDYLESKLADKCLISYIDAEDKLCVEGTDLCSKEGYYWESALTTSDYSLNNIGYTGVDNGLLRFRRDRISNKDFYNLYTNSTYAMPDDFRLRLHQISGNTALYEYPMTFESDKIKLNGGFFQGLMETECDKYQILPTTLQNGETWHFEFVLNKTEFEKESEKTLNDKYPQNKGIFFYIGTRAENKWIYEYEKSEEEAQCQLLTLNDYVDVNEPDTIDTYKLLNFTDVTIDFPCYTTKEEVWTTYYKEIPQINIEPTEETEEWFDLVEDEEYFDLIEEEIEEKQDEPQYEEEKVLLYVKETVHCGHCSGETSEDDYDYIEPELDISTFDYLTESGFNIKASGEYFFETDNKFLIFDRTCHGFNVKNWEDDMIVRYYGHRNNFQGNLFLLMNRTCTGYNVNTIDEYRDSFKKEYNIYKDLYNNALAFRITDSGAIGYRYYTIDCSAETQTTMHEAYSFDGVIEENEWYCINVAVHASQTKMQLYFYVNGRLVFVSDEMDKLDLRALNEVYEKQEAVPYNISLGGGSQGLCDVILPNYNIDPYKLLPLEEYFSGTFIGYIKIFRFYNCALTLTEINNNFIFEKANWATENIYKENI